VTVVANPPIWQQNRQYSARLDRTVVDLIYTEGVVGFGAGEFLVTETSPQSLSVAVAIGRAVIQGDDETRQGKYLVVNDTVLNVPIAAAPTANSRIDRIVLQVNDPVAGSTRTPTNVAEVVAITGTVSGSPSPPAIPDTAISLATVAVGTSATTITNADITDTRTGSSSSLLEILRIVEQIASHTLVLSDAGAVVEMNVASANTLTVPTNATVPYPIGTTLLVVQTGAGQTTIAGAGGVTVNAANSALKLASQWATATLIKRGTNLWMAAGDLVT